MFLASITDLKKYVSVANSFELKSVAALKPDAISKYFRPWMGEALVTTIESYKSEGNEIKKKSFDLMENALAKFVIFDNLITGQFIIDNGSITRIENENSKTAYKNQILDAREMYEETALTIIEELIEHFETNTGTFPLWADSPNKKLTNKLLIKTASEFNSIETLYRKNTTFYSLITTQITCLDLFIRSHFTSDLISEIILSTNLSEDKQFVKEYIQKALANFTIATAIKKSLVKFSKDGVRQLQQDNTTASKIESKADNDAISKTINEFMDTASRYVSLADSYINNNLTAFGLTVQADTFVKSKPWV